MSAVAVHVYHDVASKFLTKIERHLRYKLHREWIVAVHVENRRLDHFRHVGGVHRRTPLLGKRGETDLVVHDYVYGAAHTVTSQLIPVEGNHDNSLPRKGWLAKDKEQQHFPV